MAEKRDSFFSWLIGLFAALLLLGAAAAFAGGTSTLIADAFRPSLGSAAGVSIGGVVTGVTALILLRIRDWV
ncbi:MAG TPA: hypothetical protein VJI67_01455 [archaeon]|nr:hypothetical protein [archaeon]HLD80404.1 hypothetical protein [archaeon]